MRPITFLPLFKKNGGKIPGNFKAGNTKLAKKAVNEKTWMNVWKSWAESKGLNDDIVRYEAKELGECLS